MNQQYPTIDRINEYLKFLGNKHNSVHLSCTPTFNRYSLFIRTKNGLMIGIFPDIHISRIQYIYCEYILELQSL